MLLHDLNGRTVCILGYGKEGKAMVKALEEFAPECAITIADKNPATLVEGEAHGKQIGEGWLENLGTFDVIIKSPGIPPKDIPAKVGKKITNSTQIFLEEAAARGATVIGVTGSKGKSTTSTLIHEILKAGDKKTFLVGNIGEPAIAHLKDASLDTARSEPQRTIFVLEMSSYQLMDCHVSPPISVITTFFPEHLDYHSTRCGSLMASPASSTPLENYLEAKSHITRFQTEADFVVYDASSSGAEEIAMHSPGKRIAAQAEDLPAESMELKGEHNRRNAAIAFLTTRLLGIPERVSIPVIQNFQGLPHRLQSLGIRHGAEWVDDAISTTPESTIAALNALGDRVATIILGGQDRGNDFTALGKRIAESKIKTVILFPGSGPRIREAIQASKAHIDFFEVETMQEAVERAKSQIANRKSQIVPIVLLSTASPSYGMFRNFEEKGDVFRRCIEGKNLV
ncbi:UDP-N-acetylmuramoylalanine--D-glutamate ligase [Candidatus Peribacteria bacterium RIFCSPHIGHO2_01_FULL_55_13]|nr:MAG: UDP-N-acetylmuramoylalanine--D-glutamate ligase [Candidatus Peribacteria bacterium RIFCSPHIGHO2_01_FULL_55_13]OGJ66056.1 MAG: UDP-N-acetylmuramoylalanine--D-glutamate ligase [Candidatus Peribacteria bacterium RIFCSPHIGHO2_12_FULL_55_11]